MCMCSQEMAETMEPGGEGDEESLPDEGGCGVMGYCLGQHGLAAAGRAIHQHTPRRVDANLRRG